MGPKLTEMDEVIKMIDSSITQSQQEGQGRTLLVGAALFWLTGIAGVHWCYLLLYNFVGGEEYMQNDLIDMDLCTATGSHYSFWKPIEYF